MSYEPRIFIRKSSLDKKKETINNDYFALLSSNKKKTDKMVAKEEALHVLYKASDLEAIIFPELSIVMISPDLTSRNAMVRKMLDDYEIDYKLLD